MKICTKCGSKKEDKSFKNRVTKNSKPGDETLCDECRRKVKLQRKRAAYKNKFGRLAVNRWEQKHSHKVAEYRRRARLKQYGLTPEDYDKMYKNQDGYCAICGRHQSKLAKTLAVDHNHTTGVVRALLCNQCNGAIGLLQDDPDLVLRAYEYLREFTD